MRKTLRLVVMLCLMASSGLFFGCHAVPLPGPFEGQVTDSQSDRPIVGAEVEAESWCHDNPLPDGPGSFFVRAKTKTDSGGFFLLTKETRRGGFFGCSFALKINATGYIPTNVLYEPKGVPLPPETLAFPFINTSTLKEFPAKLEIRLAPAVPVFLKAIKSGNSLYRDIAREKLAKLVGADYGFDHAQWKSALVLKGLHKP